MNGCGAAEIACEMRGRTNVKTKKISWKDVDNGRKMRRVSDKLTAGATIEWLEYDILDLPRGSFLKWINGNPKTPIGKYRTQRMSAR